MAYSNPIPLDSLYIWVGLSLFIVESGGRVGFMETHPPLAPQTLVQSSPKVKADGLDCFPLMRDCGINGHGPSGAPVSRLAKRAGVPAGSYKRRGEGLDCLAAEQYLQAASRRHPSFVLPRVVRPAQKVLPQSRLDSAPLLGSHSSAQASGTPTNDQQTKKVKIRCMRSRSCFWWPPTGN